MPLVSLPSNSVGKLYNSAINREADSMHFATYFMPLLLTLLTLSFFFLLVLTELAHVRRLPLVEPRPVLKITRP